MNDTRSITRVIRACLKVVPDDESALRHDLDSLRDSCCYTAPEDMQRRWYELAQVLDLHTARYFVPGGRNQPTTSVNWVAACQRIYNGTDPAEWYAGAAVD